MSNIRRNYVWGRVYTQLVCERLHKHKIIRVILMEMLHWEKGMVDVN